MWGRYWPPTGCANWPPPSYPAASWLPYLLLGLVVGALVDRVRRKPLLVGTELARAALLCAAPLLAWPDLLSVPVLIAIMAVFGLASLVNDATHQSFLPRMPSTPLPPSHQLLPTLSACDASTRRTSPARSSASAT